MESRIQNLQTGKQIISAVRLTLFVAAFSYTYNSVAATGDELIVTESIVNVRAGPSTDAEPLIKLLKDRKVTEIQRQDNWVEVETHRDDIKTGWIHKSLLRKKAAATQNTSSPTRFDHFMQRFNDYNEIIKKQNGIIYFTEAKDKGKGEIEVIATQAWISGDSEMRNAELHEIFKLWSDVVPVGSSISVHVLDEQGEQYMLMMR